MYIPSLDIARVEQVETEEKSQLTIENITFRAVSIVTVPDNYQ